MYYIYILLCGDGSLYTGITNNLTRRFEQHRNKRGGHYTASHRAEKILYTEKRRTRSAALKREAEIKSWNRTKKTDLIGKKNIQNRRKQ